MEEHRLTKNSSNENRLSYLVNSSTPINQIYYFEMIKTNRFFEGN